MAPDPTAPVDLGNCAREPIHLLGAVQAFGFLLAVSSDWVVRRASANVERHLGVAPADLLGRPLDTVFAASALHDLRGRLQMLGGTDQVERLFAVPLREGRPPFDVAVHLVDDTVVIEAEPSGTDQSFDAVAAVKAMMARLTRVQDRADYFEQAARQLRAMLGFGRVMVYRFDHDDSGEVVAESLASGFASFRGLRYPASDIPAQARALYRHNWLRVIADVDAAPAAILPADDAPLDLTSSTLRHVSPIHLEYLRNMRVAASLSISIMRGDQLWGLFACHHDAPRAVSFQRRTAAELFGQLFSLQLESREQQGVRAYEAAARRVHEQMMASLSDDRSVFATLGALAPQMQALIPSDGVAISVEGQVSTAGVTPTEEEMLGLARFLGRAASSRIYATAELGRVHPPAADYPERAAGVLAVPISRVPRDYILFFRQEVPRTVTWAGDPNKPAQLGAHGARLTPRKSFEAWREVVRGQSMPWSETERQVAESLRVTLLEIVVRLAGAAEAQRRVASARQDLLIAELNHRVRNILGLIRALVARSRESANSLENFVQVLSDRIFALAQAHDLLTADSWQPISLQALLRRELDAYLNAEKNRVRLDGPPVLIDPQAFTVLALVFHELSTNAAKYGGLSDRHGAVSVTWSIDRTDALRILWRETGGPPVRPPQRQGFGTTIIERSIPFELQGEAEVRYHVSGVEAEFVVPANYVQPGAPDRDAEPAPAAPRVHARFTGVALVVEDNAIIALEAEDMLRRLGFRHVETVGTVDHALQVLARTPELAFALLDVNLGRGTSFPVAEELRRRSIPFLFATGYGEQIALPPALAGAPALAKPYREDKVAEMAARVIATHAGD